LLFVFYFLLLINWLLRYGKSLCFYSFIFSFIIFIFWSLLWRKRKRIVGKFICTCVCVVFFLTKRVTLTAKTAFLMTTGRKMLLAACVRYYPLALYVFYVLILILCIFAFFIIPFFFICLFHIHYFRTKNITCNPGIPLYSKFHSSNN
jgi:hypothetical protein